MSKGDKVVILSKIRNGAIGTYEDPVSNDAGGGLLHRISFEDGLTEIYSIKSFKLLSEMGSVKKKRVPKKKKEVEFVIEVELEPTAVTTVTADDPKYMKAEDMAQAQEKVVGRPTKYNKDLADEICSGLSMGYSIRTVLKMGGDVMPSLQTFFSWLRLHKEFLDQYARAKEEAVDAMAEEIQDIADESANDYMLVKYGKEWVTVQNKEAMMRSKMRIEVRQWIMAKIKPRKYGNKFDPVPELPPLEGNTIVLTDYSKPKAIPPKVETHHATSSK